MAYHRLSMALYNARVEVTVDQLRQIQQKVGKIQGLGNVWKAAGTSKILSSFLVIQRYRSM